MGICTELLPLADCGKGHAQIPAAVIGMVSRDGGFGVAAAGHAQIEPRERPVSTDTWFDLASLTKVIFTTRLILELAGDGALALDDPLARHMPDLRQYDVDHAPERKLTIRQCLTHQTFLPSVVPLYTLGTDPEMLKTYVLQHVWEHGAPVYSDMNFILLGILVERVTGKPLGEQPLGPGLALAPDPAETAATEFCHWRTRIMCGQVHDENAYALGGIAGHAGLFGTAEGVLRYAHTLLQGGAVSDLVRKPQTATRTLGWNVKHDGWKGGPRCSARTIGHTGFTGTGLWIDFDRDLAWTLLTNRVHPSRHRETGITEKTRRVCDALIEAYER